MGGTTLREYLALGATDTSGNGGADVGIGLVPNDIGSLLGCADKKPGNLTDASEQLDGIIANIIHRAMVARNIDSHAI